jgi:multicomponent Na+:H+ antiporter subunit C
MQSLTAILVGILVGTGIYLILQNNLMKSIFGFGLFAHAVNVMILSMSKNPIGKSTPIITSSTVYPVEDPLPQALILTAIVIGFGVSAYMIALAYRLYKAQGHTLIEDSND